MINLLCLLCSLCIQFASAGITPYNMLPNNQSGVGDTQIDIVLDRIRNNYQGYWGDYRWVLNVPRESIIVVKGYTLWGSYNNEYTVLVPKEYNDSSVSSQIQCNNYTLDQDNTVNSVNLNFNQYIQFFTTMTFINNPYIDGYKTYQFDSSSNWELVYCEVPIYCNGDLVVNITDDVTVPEYPSFGGDLGSLGVGGHSSGGSPIDELNNNGVTWSSTHGSFTVTGHSIGNVTTPPTPDPNSNLEMILSGFLGGILNNTNDILGNTSQIGVVLGGISNNIIQGASAIFNAISNINNTLTGFINYIVEPLDQERISAKLEEVPLYQTVNSLVGFSNSFLSAISSVQDPEHLYLTMDFRNANEPFRRLGLYVFDFTFLDNLKSTWQPILLAVLYVTLGVNIFYDLPNIVHGISGMSGGDE